jgi:hypothetical protein
LGIDLNEAPAADFPLQPPASAADWTTVRGMDGSLVKP